MIVRRWLPWAALAVVLGLALAVAAGVGGTSTTGTSEQARVARIASEIRCPTCRGLSAYESEAPAAKAIRTEVANQVHQGRTDGEILAFVRDRYGSDILLRPPASGFDGLVWALPVIGFILAAAGLVWAFRRWHDAGASEASPADRERVARRAGWVCVSEQRTDVDQDAAALFEERDFLLSSLSDLDAELSAGDIDQHDYITLKDGYTARRCGSAPGHRPAEWGSDRIGRRGIGRRAGGRRGVGRRRGAWRGGGRPESRRRGGGRSGPVGPGDASSGDGRPECR